MTSNLPDVYQPHTGIAPSFEGELEAEPLDQFGYEAIIRHFAEAHHAEWLLLTRILRATGIREAEALRLKPEEIERAGPQTNLLVVRGKQRLKEGQRPKHVRVGLRSDVAMELAGYIAASRIAAWQPIFKRKARAYQMAFRKAAITTTGQAHHPHELRALYGVDLIEQGYPLSVVSKMLGHTSERTTQQWYLRMTSEQRNRINQHVRA